MSDQNPSRSDPQRGHRGEIALVGLIVGALVIVVSVATPVIGPRASADPARSRDATQYFASAFGTRITGRGSDAARAAFVRAEVRGTQLDVVTNVSRDGDRRLSIVPLCGLALDYIQFVKGSGVTTYTIYAANSDAFTFTSRDSCQLVGAGAGTP
jgi:hypothetical protein